MNGNLKDTSHLSTKSSTFHPVQMKAGAQQEIMRHMVRHYDKLKRVTCKFLSIPPSFYLSLSLSLSLSHLSTSTPRVGLGYKSSHFSGYRLQHSNEYEEFYPR